MMKWKLMVSKVYDISTIKGLRTAERYKTMLENKYDKVETKQLGMDKIILKGYNKKVQVTGLLKCDMCGWVGTEDKLYKQRCPKCGSKSVWEWER